MSVALAFWLSSSVAEKLVRGRLDGLELLLPLLAHLGDEREAIRWVHLADGLRIDALARRLHRGCGVLDRLGVLAPGRLLSGVMPSSVFSVSICAGSANADPGPPCIMPGPMPFIIPWPFIMP